MHFLPPVFLQVSPCQSQCWVCAITPKFSRMAAAYWRTTLSCWLGPLWPSLCHWPLWWWPTSWLSALCRVRPLSALTNWYPGPNGVQDSLSTSSPDPHSRPQRKTCSCGARWAVRRGQSRGLGCHLSDGTLCSPSATSKKPPKFWAWFSSCSWSCGVHFSSLMF